MDISSQLQFAVAIPVYNEASYVADVIARVKKYCSRIVIVDDGSSDGTSEILAGIDDIEVIRHEVNRGYGQALISSFQWAARKNIDWLITMDCDGQHEPCMIPRFVNRAGRGDCDLISGSRYLPAARRVGSPPPARRAINYEMTDLINKRLALDITDAFCGFKAYRVETLAQLQLSETGYAIPMEFWVAVAREQLRITEIPVSLIYNDPNRTFGGSLDDSSYRRQHYMDVFNRACQSSFGADGCDKCCNTAGDCCCH